jgi:bifunctional non-homologous end joining protein LigD
MEIATAGLKIDASQAVIDGEIVVLDQNGRPSFQALQHRSQHPKHLVVFYAFDVLHVDGQDLTGEPLELRRARLPELLHGKVLRISEELPGTPAQVVDAVKRMGLEDMVAKRKGSLYVPRGALERLAQAEAGEPARVRDRRIHTRWGDNSVDALLVGSR